MRITTGHPVLDDTLRVHLELEGDIVKTADVEAGFQHCGLEKLFETSTYDEGVTIAGGLRAGHSRRRQASAGALGYVIACEELLGMVAPPRAQVSRIVLAELTRVEEHLATLRLQALAAGVEAVASLLDERRRDVDDALAEIVGDYDQGPLLKIGGLTRDVSERVLEAPAGILRDLPGFLDRLERKTLLHRLFALRLRGTGQVTREEAIGRALTGPVLRASGVDFDVRRARPYCGYERYDFAIPAREEGDSWARFLQRLEECRESLRIIAQARDDLPEGPVDLDASGLDASDLESAEPEIVDLAAVDVEEGVKSRPQSASSSFAGEEVYSSTEAPAGELGYFLVARDQSHPHRVRVRAPSFYHAACLSELLVGERVADVPLVVASFGLVVAEIDR